MSSVGQTSQAKFAILQRPARKLVVRRGVGAEEYYAYCSEIGCDIVTKTWDDLGNLPGALGEPMGLWLPPELVRPGTSTYVHGIELPTDFEGILPEGTETIDLPPTTYVLFHADPSETMFDDVRKDAMRFDPTKHGLE